MTSPRSAFEYGITQGFGPTDEKLDGPYKGYRNFNRGYDFGAPLGSPVPATQAGTVISAGDNKDGWGLSVKVRDPNGFVHNYGHLNAVNVKPGDTIERGQLVGASGNTGRGTGPHLSYDVYQADTGEFVDPAPWVGGGRSVTNQYSGPQQGQGATESDTLLLLIKSLMQKVVNPTPDDPTGTYAARRLSVLTPLWKEMNPYTPIEIALKQFELQDRADANRENRATNIYNAQTRRFEAEGNRAQSGYQNQRQYQEDTLSGPKQNFAIARQYAADQADLADARYANQLNYYDREVGNDTREVNQAVQDVSRALQGKQEARARADQIDQTIMDAAAWALPPGTEYIPGLEPTGLFAQQAKKLGLEWDDNLHRVPEGATNATAGITINPGARIAEQDVAMGTAGQLPNIPAFIRRTPPDVPGQVTLPDPSALMQLIGSQEAVKPPDLGMGGYPEYPELPQRTAPPDLASIMANSPFGRNAPGASGASMVMPQAGQINYQTPSGDRAYMDPFMSHEFPPGVKPVPDPFRRSAQTPSPSSGGMNPQVIGGLLGLGTGALGAYAAFEYLRRNGPPEIQQGIAGMLNPPRNTDVGVGTSPPSYGPIPTNPGNRGLLPEGNNAIPMPMPDERGVIPPTPYREVPWGGLDDSIPMPPRRTPPLLPEGGVKGIPYSQLLEWLQQQAKNAGRTRVR